MVRLQYAPRCGHSMPNTEMGMLVFPDYTQKQCQFEENTDTQCQLKPALVAKKIKFTLFLDAKKNKFRQFYGAN